MTPQQLQAAVERLGDDRVRQGFERFCRNPVVLAQIVAALREMPTETRNGTAATSAPFVEVSSDALTIADAPR